ncbi:hypothetical protein MBEHAL_1389 [Halarchaeum acidiphilum MH1-52-1]|uniref:Peptidoglycan-binding protein n=1 Tax=Halarchaeum acidiphilum MH1-52-1 TaxID=1261545 RepID=U3A4Q8_9EURY|nr:DUF5822 domain-containing protein [Halarchaeum acidiphilum]GAD52629.1 hypothetical protein MBEHAL_1389 [Halarchaeum acidiphilum MH1-52-1]
MPDVVEETDPEGVDYGWVMQTTFVLTIVVGAPVVALAAVVSDASIPTWTAQAAFAVRVGAVVWFLTAVCVYLYARRTTVEPGEVSADEE